MERFERLGSGQMAYRPRVRSRGGRRRIKGDESLENPSALPSPWSDVVFSSVPGDGNPPISTPADRNLLNVLVSASEDEKLQAIDALVNPKIHLP